MKGFNTNIEEDTLENTDFRRVLYTAKHCQLVLMSLQPQEEIGMETHPENDQFLRFEGGQGAVFIDGSKYEVADGDAVIVPADSTNVNIHSEKDTLDKIDSEIAVEILRMNVAFVAEKLV